MILKIVIPLIVILSLYYAGLFIYYYRKTRSAKSALKNTVILLLPLIVLFLLVEFTFRILVSNKIMHLDKRFFTRNFATAYYFVYGEDQGLKRFIRLRETPPNTDKQVYLGKDFYKNRSSLRDTSFRFRSDEDGFIIPEYKKGNQTIIFLGGSTTECSFVLEKKRFPFLVGEKLDEKGYPFTVKNAGVSGNNTYHSINVLINKGFRYKPTTVVLMHAINDLTILMWEQTYHNKNASKSLVLDNTNTATFNTPNGTVDEFFEKRGKVYTIDTASLFGEFRKALRLFVYTCKSQNIQPVLMTQFNRIEYQNAATCKQLTVLLDECKNSFPGVDYIALYKKMNETIREISAAEKVQLIDLDRLVPKTEYHIYDAVHLNDSGSVYVANIISEHLQQYLRPGSTDTLKQL